MNKEKIAKAIEKDAGQAIPGLREALGEMERGEYARITPTDQTLVRMARKGTGLSQSRFAKMINTPVRTLQEWEQGRATPPGVAVKLCALVLENPKLLDVA